MITSHHHHYYQCFSIFQTRLSSFNKFLFKCDKKELLILNRFSAYSFFLAIYNKELKKKLQYKTQIHCPKIILAPKMGI